MQWEPNFHVHQLAYLIRIVDYSGCFSIFLAYTKPSRVHFLTHHIIPDVHIDHVLTEKLTRFTLTPVGGSVQGGPSIDILRVQLRAALYQHIHDADVTFGRSHVEGRGSGAWMRLHQSTGCRVTVQPPADIRKHLPLLLTPRSVAIDPYPQNNPR